MGWGKKVSTTISRNGDLITDVILEITLTKDSASGSFYPAEALLQEIELEIGGQRIDKHYADWFRVYDSLFRKNDEQAQYRRMTDWVDGESDNTVKRFYLPLIFFFNRSPGMALPLIALTAARKSILPPASGICGGVSQLGPRGAFEASSQMLVACC